ncbi:transcription initiation factor TFIID subunit [Thraustotheca clavata]|uniref:Transcription initiation factor TFIID subunit 5 n=1 Tax=Thraustotheca clavata TaxID=74557 RepID=A0A1V9ZRW8_9STRA|nr:transcription initiation factor TFIID subunit [Thraustotheca clavata]
MHAPPSMDDMVASYLSLRGYGGSSNTMRGPAQLQEFSRHMGLSMDACAANHVLFHNMNKADPNAYERAYSKLLHWIGNALDMYKLELHAVAFPLFVHCYLELVSKGYTIPAKRFYELHAKDHVRLHRLEIRQLACVLTREHLTMNEYSKQVLHSKFQIQMSLLTFQLLHTFLSDYQMFILLYILNERVCISVTSNHPSLVIQPCDSIESIVDEMDAPLFQSSDDISQEVEHSPDDNHVAVQITSGPFDMHHMATVAGSEIRPGKAGTLEDLHRIPINWGVFPPRRVPKPSGNVNGDGEDGGDGMTSPGDGAPDSISQDTANDKSKASSIKPEIDAEDSTNPTLEKDQIVGPTPNRSTPYNAEILEKLVLRQPPNLLQEELQHAQARLELNSMQLPSALCFTVLNAYDHMNNVAFNSTGSVVGAAFDDTTFRVWSQDNQPLGGYGNHTDNTSAVLRGHSGPVYGCAFTPDSRFALTSSADTTIRLWSLASRSNMVCYRAHNYPVWDVKMGHLGYYFVSASMDRTARFWSTDRVQPLRIFAGHLSDVETVAIHPNYNYIATGSTDKSVRIWDVQTGTCIRVFTGHYGAVHTVAFSPNGRYLASAGEDAFVNVWDLHMNKRVDTLLGHTKSVYSLAFSQESSILVSGGADHTVRLWDMYRLGHDAITEKQVAVHVKQKRKTNSFINSRALMKTFTTKQTPVVNVQFTPRNMLLVGGFGSCNDQAKPQPLWPVIARENVDLWVWLGDNIYGDYRAIDAKSFLPPFTFFRDAPPAMLEQKYKKLLDQPEYAKFRESTPIIGIWDDHDYGRNDGCKVYPYREQSQEYFLDFLQEPKESSRRQQQGIYTSYTFGSDEKLIKFIMLDVRYHKDPYGTMNGDFLGETQWQWLENELATTKAAFNIIASGVQILPTDRWYGGENWARFPSARERLLKLILQSQAKGIVLLSGDVHFAEINQVKCGAEQLTEITSSGMTHAWQYLGGSKWRILPAWIFTLGNIYLPWQYRVDNFFAGLNFGDIQFDWNASPPTATFNILDKHGTIKLSHRAISTSISAEMDQECKAIHDINPVIYMVQILVLCVTVVTLVLSFPINFYIFVLLLKRIFSSKKSNNAKVD